MSEPSPSKPLDPEQRASELLSRIKDFAQFLEGDLSKLPPRVVADLDELNPFDTHGIKLPPRLVPLPITEATYLASPWKGVPADVGGLLAKHAFYYFRVPVTSMRFWMWTMVRGLTLLGKQALRERHRDADAEGLYPRRGRSDTTARNPGRALLFCLNTVLRRGLLWGNWASRRLATITHGRAAID